MGKDRRSIRFDAWKEQGPRWKAEGVDIRASVEPGGIQVYGEAPEELWERWYAELKAKLTAALGYEIGEPEEGYDFKYYE